MFPDRHPRPSWASKITNLNSRARLELATFHGPVLLCERIHRKSSQAIRLGNNSLGEQQGLAKRLEHQVGPRQLLAPENVKKRWHIGPLPFDSQAVLFPHAGKIGRAS